MSDSLGTFYLTGCAVEFVLSLILLTLEISRGSKTERNYQLLLLETKTDGKLYDMNEYWERPSLGYEIMAWIGFVFFCLVISPLLSWVGLAWTVFTIIRKFLIRVTAPQVVKDAWWRLANVSFNRAEDLCDVLGAAGLYPDGKARQTSIDEMGRRSEALTRNFASRQFAGDGEAIEQHVKHAWQVARGECSSGVIHPRFWMGRVQRKKV